MQLDIQSLYKDWCHVLRFELLLLALRFKLFAFTLHFAFYI